MPVKGKLTTEAIGIRREQIRLVVTKLMHLVQEAEALGLEVKLLDPGVPSGPLGVHVGYPETPL